MYTYQIHLQTKLAKRITGTAPMYPAQCVEKPRQTVQVLKERDTWFWVLLAISKRIFTIFVEKLFIELLGIYKDIPFSTAAVLQVTGEYLRFVQSKQITFTYREWRGKRPCWKKPVKHWKKTLLST